MERYYKILGLSSNATKKEVKEAYHKKIKAIHPDKVHGTSLEDTATFLSTEINEAYNILMKQPDNKHSSKTYTKHVCFEENIYVENFGLLKYSLSNDIGLIQSAIIKRTGNSDTSFIHRYGWQLNPVLSENVKNVMSKHNVNYSMTYFTHEGYWTLLINKRDGEKWYITGYEQEIRETTGKSQRSQNYGTAGNKQYNSSYNSKRKYTSTTSESHPVRNFFLIIGFAILLFYIISQGNSGQPVRATPVFATVINAEWLNVRSSPSSINNSNIVTQLRRGARVEVIERRSNSWVRIRYNNGRIGYVHGRYLTR